jgi:splicing factor U2AF 65 kDa subunit
MQLGESRLIVQLASTGSKNPPMGIPTLAATNFAGIDLSKGAGPPTEVLCLMNMVTEEELAIEEEYEGKFQL